MCFVKAPAQGTAALLLLVATVPAMAQSVTCSNGVEQSRTCPYASMVPAHESRLCGASAADLVGDMPIDTDDAWSVEKPDAAAFMPVAQQPMSVRVTSVPVALVVGGALIASLGITQQVRRARATRA